MPAIAALTATILLVSAFGAPQTPFGLSGTARAVPVDLTAPLAGVTTSEVSPDPRAQIQKRSALATGPDGALTTVWTQADSFGRRTRALHVDADGRRGPVVTVGRPPSYWSGHAYGPSVTITASGKSAVVDGTPLSLTWLDEQGRRIRTVALPDGSLESGVTSVDSAGGTAYVSGSTITGQAAVWRVDESGGVAGPIVLGTDTDVRETVLDVGEDQVSVAWSTGGSVKAASVSRQLQLLSSATVAEWPTQGNGSIWSDLHLLALRNNLSVLSMNQCFTVGGLSCWSYAATVSRIEGETSECMPYAPGHEPAPGARICRISGSFGYGSSIAETPSGGVVSTMSGETQPNSVYVRGLVFDGEARATGFSSLADPSPDGSGFNMPALAPTLAGTFLTRATSTNVLASTTPGDTVIGSGVGEVAELRAAGHGDQPASRASATWHRLIPGENRRVIQTARLSGYTPNGQAHKKVETYDDWSSPTTLSALLDSDGLRTGPEVVVDDAGTAHAVWSANQDGQDGVWAATQHRDGLTTDPVLLCDRSAGRDTISLALAPDGSVDVAFVAPGGMTMVTNTEHPGCRDLQASTGEARPQLLATTDGVWLFTVLANKLTAWSLGAGSPDAISAPQVVSPAEVSAGAVDLRSDGSGVAVLSLVTPEGNSGTTTVMALRLASPTQAGSSPVQVASLPGTLGGQVAAELLDGGAFGVSWAVRVPTWTTPEYVGGFARVSGGTNPSVEVQQFGRTPDARMPQVWADGLTVGTVKSGLPWSGVRGLGVGGIDENGVVFSPPQAATHGAGGVMLAPRGLSGALLRLEPRDSGDPNSETVIMADSIAGRDAAQTWPEDVGIGDQLAGGSRYLGSAHPETSIATANAPAGIGSAAAWVAADGRNVVVSRRVGRDVAAHDAPPTYNGQSCPSVWVLTARGSGATSLADDATLSAFLGEENGGVGLRARLKARGVLTGDGVRVTDIDYPAVSVPQALYSPAYNALSPERPFSIWMPSDYGPSEKRGVSALVSEIRGITAACGAQTRLVLAGYSQGANVVGDAIQELSAGEKQQVKAVAMFADPRFNPDDPAARGSFEPGVSGLFSLPKRPVGLGSGIRGIVRSYCRRWDPVCQSPFMTCLEYLPSQGLPDGLSSVHSSYRMPEVLPPNNGGFPIDFVSTLTVARSGSLEAALNGATASAACLNDANRIAGTREPATTAAAREIANSVLRLLGKAPVEDDDLTNQAQISGAARAVAFARASLVAPSSAAPTAQASVEPGTGGGVRPGERFRISAAGSFGPKPLIRYDWDLDGEPGYERSTVTPSVSGTARSTLGATVLRVRVVDQSNARDETTATLVVDDEAPTVPSAPATSGAEDGGEGRYHITWSAPASDGGSPIVSYVVTSKDGTAQMVVPPDLREAWLTERNGRGARAFSVRATNARGMGPESADTVTATVDVDAKPRQEDPGTGGTQTETVLPGGGSSGASQPAERSEQTPPLASNIPGRVLRCVVRNHRVSRRPGVRVTCTDKTIRSARLELRRSGRRTLVLTVRLKRGTGVAKVPRGNYTVSVRSPAGVTRPARVRVR